MCGRCGGCDGRWKTGGGAIELRGAHGSGGPKGARNGNYKHGRYTAEAIASRTWLRKTIREVRALTRSLRDKR